MATEDTDTEILARLRAAVAGSSARTVARLTGVGLGTISRLTNGQAQMGPATRAKLAAAPLPAPVAAGLDHCWGGPIEEKRCPGCGELFPRAHFALVAAKGYRDGKRRRSLCPDCHLAQGRATAERKRQPERGAA